MQLSPTLLLQLLLVTSSHATFTIQDPSDTINPADWTADNALPANLDVTPLMYLGQAITGPEVYDATIATVKHQFYSVDLNDTSVVVIANESVVTLSDVTILKEGYSSNLYQASAYGLNAAINVANSSTAYLNYINITTHNGAANVYSYGEGNIIHVNEAWLYSSGPVSHGLYAAGYGTIHANNVYHYSGGYRSSSFSGDGPEGYIYVTNAIAHTDGIGSAICYNNGLCHLTNVVGHASNAPFMFSDGLRVAVWKDCDVTGGLLAGAIIFSSGMRTEGSNFTFENTKITTLNDIPALWYGNIIASTELIHTTINSSSGVLVVANYSQVTQDFDYYASYEDNTSLLPAETTITVQDSALSGDLVAYNGSLIDWILTDYSSWTGKAYIGYGDATLSVTLDKTSNWTLTGDTSLQDFVDAEHTLSNIDSAGFTLFYNESAAANKYLKGKTVSLNGGGSAVPYS